LMGRPHVFARAPSIDSSGSGVQQSVRASRNREEALARLQQLIDDAAAVPLLRRATKPTRGSQRPVASMPKLSTA